MRFLILFALSFIYINGFSQETLDPFYIYGPREDPIFIDLGKALKQSNSASKLKLLNVDLSSGADKLVKFDSLAVLELQNNQLKNLPVNFFSNANLQYLSSSDNPIQSLSNEVFGLRSLIVLKLIKTAIDSFPPSFKYLSNLKEFEFQLNTSDSCKLGSALAGLKSIKKILINKVSLYEFPKGLHKNANLKELYLVDCGLKLMDSTLFLCPNLELLILDNNQMTSIPKEISFLKNVKRISFKNNKIRECPEYLGLLKKLEVIDFTGNPINLHHIDVLKILLPNCRIIY